MFEPHRKHVTSPLRAQQAKAISGSKRWYIATTTASLGIVLQLFFLFKTQSFGDRGRFHLKMETESSLRNVVFSE
jgi:hypothetical protein